MIHKPKKYLIWEIPLSIYASLCLNGVCVYVCMYVFK